MATGAVLVEDRLDIAHITQIRGTYQRNGHQAGDERDEAHASILARTCRAGSVALPANDSAARRYCTTGLVDQDQGEVPVDVLTLRRLRRPKTSESHPT